MQPSGVLEELGLWASELAESMCSVRKGAVWSWGAGSPRVSMTTPGIHFFQDFTVGVQGRVGVHFQQPHLGPTLLSIPTPPPP